MHKAIFGVFLIFLLLALIGTCDMRMSTARGKSGFKGKDFKNHEAKDHVGGVGSVGDGGGDVPAGGLVAQARR